MSSRLSRVPQELLFNISGFGRVAPGIDPMYVSREVRNRFEDFNWDAELSLEMKKCNSEVYSRLSGIVSAITDLRRRYHVSIDVSTIDIGATHVGVSIYYDSPQLTDIAYEAERMGYQYTIHRHGITTVIIHVNIDITMDDLDMVSFLNSPRSRLMDTTTVSIRDVTRTDDWRVSESIKLNYTPRSGRSDESIIAEILRINPAYDLGALLQWLDSRRISCDIVESQRLPYFDPQGIRRLYHDLSVVSISVIGPSDMDGELIIRTLNLDRDYVIDELESYLSYMLYRPKVGHYGTYLDITFSLDKSVGDAVDIAHDLLREYNYLQVCLNQYMDRIPQSIQPN